VRTSKESPPGKHVKGWSGRMLDIKSEELPAGEGHYVDPQPYTFTDESKTPDGKIVRESWATGFQEVDFPFKTVKPQILKGMEEAMKRRLFDEIGVLPSHRQKVDPILVGRVKRRDGYNERVMTFLIAWWIDTRSL